MSVTPEGINWPALYIWLFIAQWIFNAGLAAWLYFRKADNANADAVQEVAADLAKFILASKDANEGQNIRLQRLETTIKHLPNAQEMARLRENVATTKQRVEGIAELLTRVERQTNLIHEHLLQLK